MKISLSPILLLLLLLVFFHSCTSKEQSIITGKWKRMIVYGCNENESSGFFNTTYIVFSLKNNSINTKYFVELPLHNLRGVTEAGDTVKIDIKRGHHGQGTGLEFSIQPQQELTEVIRFTPSDRFKFCESSKKIRQLVYYGDKTISSTKFVSSRSSQPKNEDEKSFVIDITKSENYSAFYLDTLRTPNLDFDFKSSQEEEWKGAFD